MNKEMDRIDEKGGEPVTQEKGSRRLFFAVGIPEIAEPSSPFNKVSKATLKPHLEITPKEVVKPKPEENQFSKFAPKKGKENYFLTEAFPEHHNYFDSDGLEIPKDQPVVNEVAIINSDTIGSLPRKETKRPTTTNPHKPRLGLLGRFKKKTIALMTAAGAIILAACAPLIASAENSNDPPTTDTVPGSDTQENPTPQPGNTATARFEESGGVLPVVYKDTIGKTLGVEKYGEKEGETSLLGMVTEAAREKLGITDENMNITAFIVKGQDGTKPYFLIGDISTGKIYDAWNDDGGIRMPPSIEKEIIFDELGSVTDPETGEITWAHLMNEDDIIFPGIFTFNPETGVLTYIDPATSRSFAVLRVNKSGSSSGASEGSIEEILEKAMAMLTKPNEKYTYVDPEVKKMEEEGLIISEWGGIPIAISSDGMNIEKWKFGEKWEDFKMLGFDTYEEMDNFKKSNQKYWKDATDWETGIKNGKLAEYTRRSSAPFEPLIEGKKVTMEKVDYCTWIAVDSTGNELARIDMKNEDDGWKSPTGEKIPYQAVNTGNFIIVESSWQSSLRIEELNKYKNRPKLSFTRSVGFTIGSYIDEDMGTGTRLSFSLALVKLLNPSGKITFPNYHFSDQEESEMSQMSLFLPVATMNLTMAEANGYFGGQISKKFKTEVLHNKDQELLIEQWQETGEMPEELEKATMSLSVYR